jgi:molybdate transport system ATP-binding protein
VIDVALQLRVGDARRHFDLDVAFASDAPVVALYGPSGAGKSITLQAMAGLLHAQRGHVRIGGRSLFDSAAGIDVPAPDRRLGVLFQHYALFPHLSVRENVAFGLTNWRRRLGHAEAERVDALIRTFELGAMAAARPATLSGGQQQRVALARALACSPDALLLDEPFAALNPLLRQSLRVELAQVRERWRIPMVMITHDVEDVLALANVAFLVDGGRVVREVDLDRVERREAQRDLLAPEQARRPPRRHEEALRVMLGADASRGDA